MRVIRIMTAKGIPLENVDIVMAVEVSLPSRHRVYFVNQTCGTS